MPSLNVFGAERYVVAALVNGSARKLFQIAFSKKDGSLFVTFPYLKGCGGRLGVVTIPKGSSYFDTFTVGQNFPATSHLPKYSHHPSGQAHFSLSGKVRTAAIKQAVPLSQAGGHIFTARFQGFSHFNELERNRTSTKQRGIIPFSFEDEKNVQSIKFVCHIQSEDQLTKRGGYNNTAIWMKVQLPDGRMFLGIALATPFYFEGVRRYLILYAECTDYFITNVEKGISFMGGFDPEDVVFDHSRDTTCLMMFIHELTNMNQLAATFGSIDL